VTDGCTLCSSSQMPRTIRTLCTLSPFSWLRLRTLRQLYVDSKYLRKRRQPCQAGDSSEIVVFQFQDPGIV
jgi:hypothetical protein